MGIGRLFTNFYLLWLRVALRDWQSLQSLCPVHSWASSCRESVGRRKPSSRHGNCPAPLPLKSGVSWEDTACGSRSSCYKEHSLLSRGSQSFLLGFSCQLINSTRTLSSPLLPQCLVRHWTHGNHSGFICWINKGTNKRTTEWKSETYFLEPAGSQISVWALMYQNLVTY